MTASVTIVTRSEEGLAVLLEALNFTPTQEMLGKEQDLPQDGSGKNVWLQTANGLERRSVKTGLSDGIYAIVESGLEEGDAVVLSVSLERKEKGAVAANPLMPRRGGRR